MNLTEKAAYLKGLMEGLDLDASKKEVKVMNAMYGMLEELAQTVSDLNDDVDQVYDEIDAIDEDLSDLEEVIFDDDDDDDECDCGDDEMYDITCPSCGETISVDEETLLNEDLSCPNCGANFEIDFDEDDEEDGESEDAAKDKE